MNRLRPARPGGDTREVLLDLDPPQARRAGRSGSQARLQRHRMRQRFETV